MMSHYQRLGVARDAPPEVIRAAYKALAQTNHPDKNLDNPAAKEIMQEINQAYAVLNDPQKRAEYDQWLGRQEAAVQAEWTQPPSQSSAPPPRQRMRRLGEKINAIVFFGALAGAMVFSFGYYAFFNTPSLSQAMRTVIPALPPPAVPPPAGTDSAAAPPALSQRQLAACVFAAARTYAVPPAVLLGLLSTEEGAAGRESRVADGSYDLGPLQINTWWVPRLARLWNVSEDAAKAMLRDDACVNIGVGAWILHAALRKGGSPAAGIARYDFSAHHLASHPADAHSAYVEKALRLIKLYRDVSTPEDLFDGKASGGKGGH